MSEFRITETEALLIGQFRLAFGDKAALNPVEQNTFIETLREAESLVDDFCVSPLLARDFIGRNLIVSGSEALVLIGQAYLDTTPWEVVSARKAA